jgi:signal transduction histidine kinase
MGTFDEPRDEVLLELEAARARILELERENAGLEERLRSLIAAATDAEGAMKAERQRFYDVLETLPVFVVLMTPDYHVPFANRFFRERFGEISDGHCFEQLFQYNKPCENCESHTVLKTMESHEWEWTAPDGRKYSIFDFPFIDTDGSTLILEMGIDLTEQKDAQEALRRLNETLEQRVEERTDALKKSEEQLREQAARLQATLDAAPVVILSAKDSECHELYGNRFARELAGVPEGTNLSRTGPTPPTSLRFRISKDGVEMQMKDLPIQKVASSGVELRNYSYDWVFDNGEIRTMFGNIVPVFDSEGKPNGAIAALLDITEQRRIEEQAKESEELARRRAEELQKLMDAAPIAIWVSNDPDCYQIFGNPTAIQAYEAGPEDNLSAGPSSGKQDFTRRFFGNGRELRPEELPMQEAAAKNTEVRNSEVDVLLPSGKTITMLGNASPLLDASGHVRGAIGSFLDITERKQAEEALRKARDEAEGEKRRLEAVMETLPVGMAIIDEKGGCIHPNAMFQRIWGGSRPGIHPPTKSVKDYAAYQAWWADTGEAVQPEEWASALVVQKGEAVVDQLIEIRRFDGTYGFIMNSAAPIRDADGRIRGAAVAVQDITELRRAQESLRESEARYRQLSKSLKKTVREQVEQLRQAESLAAIGRMVAIVAHEIRNPLLNIHLGTDTLRDLLREDREKQEILNEIEHGVSLLNSTVSELLEYARPIHLDCKPRSIGAILRQTLRTLSQQLRGISVDMNLENDKRELLVDSPKMVRALTNIIQNAAEAMLAGGNLKLESRLSARGRLSLSISDTGTGMDAKTLACLFQPFFTTKVNGTGLGLGIAKKIIEAHNGRISVKSKVNKGTTVKIILPVSVKR